MKQRQTDERTQYGECREGELMYRTFDDEDWDHADTHSRQAGEPDAESADSMSCWFGGLLEDPFDDTNSSEEEDDSDFDVSVFIPWSKESSDEMDGKLESFSER